MYHKYFSQEQTVNILYIKKINFHHLFVSLKSKTKIDSYNKINITVLFFSHTKF